MANQNKDSTRTARHCLGLMAIFCIMLVVSGCAGTGLEQEASAATSYALSGVWKFKDSPSPYNPSEGTVLNCSSEAITQSINFASNGQSYAVMRWYGECDTLVLVGEETYTS